MDQGLVAIRQSGVCVQIPICEIVYFWQGEEEGGEQLS